MYDMILIRYGEMTLKKKNYKQFLKAINDNIKDKIKDIPNIKFVNTDYRAYIYLNGQDYNLVIDKLGEVVGLYSYSLCKEVNKDIEDIAKWGIEIINDYINEANITSNFTFKVETHRGDKRFPLTSLEISSKVAGLVLPKIEKMSVDVHNPDVTLHIDLRSEGAYIYTNTIKGLGGYPSGIGGEALLMMSGGIDSPVAGFLTIKKGVKISAIHYASPPYTSPMALQKVIDLLKVLAKYQGSGEIDLYVVPFTDVQTAIHEKANQIYLVTIMRRMMYTIATKLARDLEISALVNGESIGQVASQTLESMMVVNDVTNIPILRPLCAMDKLDIIGIASKINTYDISIRPYEDCCTVFVPEHPIIKPRLEDVKYEEAKCNLEPLVEAAYQNIKKYTISIDSNINVFE
ncbi:MAG: tRNA 4-thiouridine(8) synthase ThiI [Bacilli bacterium]|nr:tRNA 4-thiouridine(8) synthase ThiI [Bacilli bacterium]MBP5551081.1 tRNA 4-thiouridine(8) synthase ThiI [Bacilli bacterium]